MSTTPAEPQVSADSSEDTEALALAAAEKTLASVAPDNRALLSGLIAMIKPAALHATTVQTQIRNAEGGTASAIAEIINTSDNEDVAKARTEIAAAEEKIAAALEKIAQRKADLSDWVEANLLGDDVYDVEAGKKEFAEAKADLTGKDKAIRSFFGDDVASAAYLVNDVVIPGGLRQRNTAGSASGIKRPRLATATLDGTAVTDKDGKVSFGILATEIKSKHGISVEVSDLQTAAFKAAGTDDLPTTPTTFVFVIAGKKAGQDFKHDATIVVTAREK